MPISLSWRLVTVERNLMVLFCNRKKIKIGGCLGLGVGIGRMGGVTTDGYGVSFGGDESDLKLIVVMVVETLCIY